MRATGDLLAMPFLPPSAPSVRGGVILTTLFDFGRTGDMAFVPAVELYKIPVGANAEGTNSLFKPFISSIRLLSLVVLSSSFVSLVDDSFPLLNEEFFLIPRPGERLPLLGLPLVVTVSVSPLICSSTVDMPTETAAAALNKVEGVTTQPPSFAYSVRFDD
jgi:hypothetical protein